MAKTLTLLDKVSLRQKGWKLFYLVLFLQISFMCIAYFMQ
ncbi:KGW motif small protein [Acinetobacter sp. B51(2017)]